jgi:hypothetical protein
LQRPDTRRARMRNRTGLLYWVATGAVMGFGLIGLMTIGFPFLIAGLAMAGVGVWKPGVGGAWGVLIGFSGLPALVFLSHIAEGARSALNPFCDQSMGPGTPLPPPPGPVECAYIPGSYYVMFAVFAAIALAGLALGLLLRARSRAATA